MTWDPLHPDWSDVEGAMAYLRGLVDEDSHVAEFTDEGWSIQHPLPCRPDLQGCEVHKAVAEEAEFIGGSPVEELGRYVVTLGPNGPDYEPVNS
jgi:hypothetical protein